MFKAQRGIWPIGGDGSNQRCFRSGVRRGGTVLDLSDIPEQAKLQDWSVVQQAFLLPGDYDTEIAVTDTQTEEYSFARRKLHVKRPAALGTRFCRMRGAISRRWK